MNKNSTQPKKLSLIIEKTHTTLNSRTTETITNPAEMKKKIK